MGGGYRYHTIELALDRLKAEPDNRSRIAEAVEQALALADGLVAVVRGESMTRSAAASSFTKRSILLCA